MSLTSEKTNLAAETLLNTQASLAERFRALFTLRGSAALKPRTPETEQLTGSAIGAIGKCLRTDSSALLKHECAYCLGQMCDTRAIPVLSETLADTLEHPMVRHEAGEALGAIGDPSARSILETHLSDKCSDVSQTCELALARLDWLEAQKASGDSNQDTRYSSVDPAPPSSDRCSVSTLTQNLLNSKLPLFDRYRAMFALRDLGSSEAILALASALKRCQDSSALFRHEVAYVLGQIQSPLAIPQLTACLDDLEESEMVRHEAAEALGSIATPEASLILQKYSADSKRVVSESVQVALDMAEYENSQQLHFVE